MAAKAPTATAAPETPGLPGDALPLRFRPTRLSAMLLDKGTYTSLSQQLRDQTVPRSVYVEGPTGCGKTTLNTILAQYFTCNHPTPEGDPCFKCESCKCFSVRGINHPDVLNWNGSAEGGVDSARSVISRIKNYPMLGRHLVVFIDEAQGLSTAAEKALLLDLENPPAKTVFLVGSMEPEKVSKAIKDRCLSIHLKHPTQAQLVGRLVRIAAMLKTPISKEIAAAIADLDNTPRAAIAALGPVLASIRSGNAPEIEADPHATIQSLVKPASAFVRAKSALVGLYANDPAAFIEAVSGSDNALFLIRTMLTQNADLVRYRFAPNSITNKYAMFTASDLSKAAEKHGVGLPGISRVGAMLADALKLSASYQVDAVSVLIHGAVALGDCTA